MKPSAEFLSHEGTAADSVHDEFVIPHQLCEQCRPIAANLRAYAEQVEEKGLDAPEVVYEHYDSISGLADSARQGCHLCSILSDHWGIWNGETESVNQEMIADGNGVRVATTVHSMTSSTRCLEFSLDIYHSRLTVQKPGINVHRHIKNPRDPEWQPFCESTLEREAQWPEETRFRWSKSTGSEVAHEMVTKQLRTCIAEHRECQGGKPLDFNPTRLLDLSPFHDSNTLDIRVVSGSTAVSDYAALSYSWGNGNHLLLTPDNHGAFQQRIPWNDLPKTMRDAIVTCRRLAIRYLWVDALCIMQGPNGDFQQEAALMQEVYSGSKLTIAAAESSNAHGGCFRERFPLRYADCRIYEDKEQLIYVRGWPRCDSTPVSQRLEPSDLKNTNGTPGNCILDERAWVFQERMLSPRTIYFGQCDIHFECRKALTCESKPSEEDPEDGGAHSWWLWLKRVYLKLLELGDHPTDRSLQKFQKRWGEILETYSETSLSHEEDRLSAISGIISITQEPLGLRTTFGLFTAFFLDELCWYISYSMGRTVFTEPRVSQFEHMPTWSWLHLTGSAVCNLNNFPYRSKSLDRLYAARETTSPDCTPFIQLPELSRYRNLLGLMAWCVRCRPVRVVDSIRANTWVLVPFDTPPKEVYGDDAECHTWPPFESTLRELFDPISQGRSCHFMADQPSTITEGQDLYCLLLKRDRMRDRFGAVHMWDFGLVLQKNTEDGHDVFTRVGAYCEGNSRLDIKERESRTDVPEDQKDDEELMDLMTQRRWMFPGAEGEEMEVLIR